MRSVRKHHDDLHCHQRVHDGVVFAADSAVVLITTSLDGTSGVHNVWKHSLKVFNLHTNVVAMFAGMGNFGRLYT